MTRYGLFSTAHGIAAIAWRGVQVAALRLPAGSEDEVRQALVRRLPGAVESEAGVEMAAIIRRICAYFDGVPSMFDDIGLDLGMSDGMYARIYAAVRALPWGEVTTYGAIARQISPAPELPRMVGQAMARNPVPLIIPCHRVLPTGGGCGGFSAPGGSAAKERMLTLEGVRFLTAPAHELAQRNFGF